MSKTIVVIGAGAFGIGSANHIKRLSKGEYKVTLISASKNAYFLPAGIRLPITQNFENVIFPLTDVVDKGIEIIYDEVTNFTETTVTTKSGNTINFDALVLATGSKWSSPVGSTFEFGNDHKQYFKKEHDKIEAAKSIVLIGGGFVNAEFAGELYEKYESEFKSGKKKLSIVQNSDKLLPQNAFFSENLRTRVTSWFKEHGIKLYLNSKGEQSTTDPSKVIINGSEEIEADLVYYGTGIKPLVPANDLDDVTDARGFVRVDKTLRVKAASKGNIFAIGDVTDFVYHGLLKKDNWVKTIAVNVNKYLNEGPSAKLMESSTFEGNIISIVALGSNNALGQLPLPLIGTVKAPEFLGVKIKSKQLLADRAKKMMTE